MNSKNLFIEYTSHLITHFKGYHFDYVNHLEDPDYGSPESKFILKNFLKRSKKNCH